MPSTRTKVSRRVLVTGGLATAALATAATAQNNQSRSRNMLVFIGTYTNAKSKGIYAFRMDGNTGALTPVGLVAETASPSFLAIHPNRKFLYAANEVESFGGAKSGAITAFAIDAATGKLTELNQQPSRGAAPCHLVVDRTGKNVLVANYTGGNVAVLAVGTDGKLAPAVGAGFVQHEGKSVDSGRQEAPHAHSFNLSPDNRFAFAADLGLDKVLIYRFDPANHSITANEPPSGIVPPGSGPRHFSFHPSGRYAYVINEMKSTVTVFDYEGTRGALRAKQTISTLPAGFTGGSSTAEVQVHPSGRFLYGSNRGHDSISIFSIDPTNGQLTHVGNEPTQGKTPRNFGIDPSGNFLIAANQGSDSLVVFRIDQTTGKLKATGVKAEVPIPVCVKFLQVD